MPHSVLIADDDGAIRAVIRRSLEQAGYSVCEAASGAEAIRALRAGSFDLVITDILMPDQDGLETIIHLRKQRPHTKVIAISGAPEELFLASALGLGAARSLAKPFRPADLMALVHDLLGPLPAPARPAS